MHRRPNLLSLALVTLAAVGLFAVAGCETTAAKPAEAASGSANGDAASSAGEAFHPDGGNVRVRHFHPTMPSEIQRADYRFW